MLFKGTGQHNKPIVILLHGGGLSHWSTSPVKQLLQDDYHVISVTIDGHGDNFSTTFISIEDSARKIIQYINEQCNGHIHTLAGLSIGAQIVCEVLSLAPAITENAIIESALVLPIIGTKLLTVPMIKLSFPLIRYKWFSKLQAKTLMIPEDKFENYYLDSLKMTKESLINMTLSNGNYHLKDSISATRANIYIAVGGKEISIMKRSAKLLHERLPNSQLHIIEKMKHGELGLKNPDLYISLLFNS